MNMATLIFIILFIGAVVFAYCEAKIIDELEKELEDAQMWIDPVALEEMENGRDIEEGEEWD